MKKLATLLLSTALVGGLTFTAFVPAASADDSYRGMNRGNFASQQAQDQNWQRPGMQGSFQRGQNAGPDLGQGGIVHFFCSVNGAPRLEIALNNLSDRLTLAADQTTLFDAFKTALLTAQTGFADACQLPAAGADTQLNPVEQLNLSVSNETARIAAIDSVLPSFEAFYNSLSDTQKAQFAIPLRGDMHMAQGQFGPGQDKFGPRQNSRGMGPGPDNGPGAGPGNGQGNGPSNGPGNG